LPFVLKPINFSGYDLVPSRKDAAALFASSTLARCCSLYRGFVPKRARAESLVREVEAVVGGRMTDVARETLTAAIALDLVVLADSARDAEARIVKIETQLRVLADAVLAMDDPKKQNFAIALRAVKDNF